MFIFRYVQVFFTIEGHGWGGFIAFTPFIITGYGVMITTDDPDMVFVINYSS
jgi:hypothetical protein